MVVGFNHNFRYKGEVYHIQTEDSGIKSPNIVTLLYHGGTILASKKTSYADITKIDNLEQVVEELMKEQHKEMLRRLKAGQFDAVIESFQTGRTADRRVAAEAPVTVVTAAPQPVPATTPPTRPVAVPVAAAPSQTKPAPETSPKTPSPAATASRPPSPAIEHSLDEVILSYLMGDDK